MEDKRKCSTRLKIKYFELLKQEAITERRTLSFIMNRIIEEYYKRKEKDPVKVLSQRKRITLKLPSL